MTKKLSRVVLSASAILAVLLCAAGAPSSAADLSGTAWVLSGPMTTKAKMGGRVQQDTATVGSYIEFADGTCALDIGDGVILPCTWASPNRNKVLLTINAEPLRAALEQELEDQIGPGLSVSLVAKPAKGRLGRDLSSLTLKLRFTGTVTGAMLPKTMKLWIKATQSGAQVTVPLYEPVTDPLLPRLADGVERVLR